MSTKMKFIVEVGLWDRRYRRPVRLHTVVRVEVGQRTSSACADEAAEVMQEMLVGSMKAMWGEGHPFHTLDVDVQDSWAESEGSAEWGTEAEVTLEIYDTTQKAEVGITNEAQLDIINVDPMAFLGGIANEVAAIASSNEWLVAVALKLKPDEHRTFALDQGDSLGVSIDGNPMKTVAFNAIKDPANVTAEEVAAVLQQSLPMHVHASVGAKPDEILIQGLPGSSAVIKLDDASEGGQPIPPEWEEDDAV